MKKRRGVAIVEMAVVSLPLFLILMGIIEGGWFFFVLQTAQHASREGARTGCLMTSTNSTITSRVNQTINGIPHETKISRYDQNGICFGYCNNPPQPDDPKCVLKVRVDVPYNEISMTGELFRLPDDIERQTMINIEGCIPTP
jgi:hypothetical protein